MLIGLLIEVPGETQEQYDAIIKKALPDGTLAPGGIVHVAGPVEGGWRVVEVWETRQAFDKFYAEKLQPALQEAGVPPVEPTFFSVHNVIERVGIL